MKQTVDPDNILNDLDAKEYMKLKRSWFVLNAPAEKEYVSGAKLKKVHPATYPKLLVERMLRMYSKKGGRVLDPMCGSGSTLVQAALMDREAFGIELNPDYCQIATKILADYGFNEEYADKLTIACGDAIETVRKLEPEIFDYVLFSPPYVDFLHRSSGGVLTRHKKRELNGLSQTYSDSVRDIGNTTHDNWRIYLVTLANELYRVTKPGHMMTIVIQNEMRMLMNPIAWRLGLAIMDNTLWDMKPENLWCQEEKKLTIHGWSNKGFVKTFVTNNHHHYCLNYIKPKED